jgi:hypothetical protein
MTMLVTLQEAKDQLEMDHALSDEQITLKIKGASAAILGYLKDNALNYVDTSGEVTAIIPDDIKLATLVLVGNLYPNRGEDGGTGSGWSNYLPPQVVGLIYRYRTPTAQ